MDRKLEIKLFGCNSLSEFLTMYFGFSMKDKMSVFSEMVQVPKGTNFYRVRRVEGIKDPNDPKEWEPVPTKFSKQGRFNSKGESVLYVASSSEFLEKEIGLKENEEYYLAKYICKKSFSVGSFVGVSDRVNMLIHKIAMSVSSKDELSETERSLLDKYYIRVKEKSLFELAMDMLAPLYIYRLFPNIYDATNKLARIVLKTNDYGIRYSSVYTPIELSGAPKIFTLDGLEYGNYVLTWKGYNNLELVSVEKRIAQKHLGLELFIKEFSKVDLCV